MRSYDKSYLPYVAENVGTMFEYAAASGFKPQVFWEMFVLSDVAKGIEIGNARFLVGYSAIDLVNFVINSIRAGAKLLAPKPILDRTCYYWAGWALAQYQYESGKTFYEINRNFPIGKVLDLYDVLHEADITKFFDIADEWMKAAAPATKLQRICKARGLTQRELAQKSGVDIRSIQMYEQRKNDINKAQADTLAKIARCLNCQMEDLME